jgi:hypothetical protein
LLGFGVVVISHFQVLFVHGENLTEHNPAMHHGNLSLSQSVMGCPCVNTQRVST